MRVGDREFLWHISGNEVESETSITVGTESGRFFLFIDPYAHDFEIKPSSVRSALEWALREGWSVESGGNRGVAFSTETKDFYWLPEGIKFAYKMTSGESGD